MTDKPDYEIDPARTARLSSKFARARSSDAWQRIEKAPAAEIELEASEARDLASVLKLRIPPPERER